MSTIGFAPWGAIPSQQKLLEIRNRMGLPSTGQQPAPVAPQVGNPNDVNLVTPEGNNIANGLGGGQPLNFSPSAPMLSDGSTMTPSAYPAPPRSGEGQGGRLIEFTNPEPTGSNPVDTSRDYSGLARGVSRMLMPPGVKVLDTLVHNARNSGPVIQAARDNFTADEPGERTGLLPSLGRAISAGAKEYTNRRAEDFRNMKDALIGDPTPEAPSVPSEYLRPGMEGTTALREQANMRNLYKDAGALGIYDASRQDLSKYVLPDAPDRISDHYKTPEFTPYEPEVPVERTPFEGGGVTSTKGNARASGAYSLDSIEKTLNGEEGGMSRDDPRFEEGVRQLARFDKKWAAKISQQPPLPKIIPSLESQKRQGTLLSNQVSDLRGRFAHDKSSVGRQYYADTVLAPREDRRRAAEYDRDLGVADAMANAELNKNYNNDPSNPANIRNTYNEALGRAVSSRFPEEAVDALNNSFDRSGMADLNRDGITSPDESRFNEISELLTKRKDEMTPAERLVLEDEYKRLKKSILLTERSIDRWP